MDYTSRLDKPTEKEHDEYRTIATVQAGGNPIPIFINDIFRNGREIICCVETQDGSAPFSRWTSGGYVFAKEDRVPIAFLKDIQTVKVRVDEAHILILAEQLEFVRT